jgi:nitrogen fixation protein
MVVRQNNDNLLLAIPTKAGAGPEMVVARTQGAGTGFLQLVFEPGWQLKRRAYGGRNLGHVYLYREAWPGADQPMGQQPVDGAVQPAN